MGKWGEGERKGGLGERDIKSESERKRENV
jgi:hypothetical protein